MADRYRYLSADLKTGEVRDEVPFQTVTYGQRLSGAPEFTGTIPVDHPRVTGDNRANVEAARTVVYVERGGLAVGEGIIWDPRKEPGSRDLTCGGAGLASYLSHRRIRETRDYQLVDLFTLAADLVDYAQGNGDPAFGVTTGPADGDVLIDTSAVGLAGVDHIRTFPGHERKGIGEALAELDALEDGIDWQVTIEGGGDSFDRVLRLWHPNRRRRTDLVLEWGTNLDDYGIGHLGTRTANLIDAVGQGEGADMKLATAQDVASLSARPVLEDVLPMKDVTSTADLASAARAEVGRRKVPPIAGSLKLVVGRMIPFGAWALGDEFRVKIDDGWVQIDRFMRVVAWSITVNAEHDEDITLTVEPV